jgi:hypothetical protein
MNIVVVLKFMVSHNYFLQLVVYNVFNKFMNIFSAATCLIIMSLQQTNSI